MEKKDNLKRGNETKNEENMIVKNENRKDRFKKRKRVKRGKTKT